MVARFQISNLTNSGIGAGSKQVTKFVVHSNAAGLRWSKLAGRSSSRWRGTMGELLWSGWLTVWEMQWLLLTCTLTHVWACPMLLWYLASSLFLDGWDDEKHHMPFSGAMCRKLELPICFGICVCVGRLPPRNHLSRFFGLMERNPRILHLWCRFDNYGNCDQNSVAFRLSSLALLWPNHSLRSHQASRDMYHSGLMFAKLHLVLSKKSFELLGCLKEDVPVCWETALLGVSLMCPLQDAEASLDHQTKSTCCLVSLAKINEPFNFAWSHSGFWSSTFGDQASEALGCNHLVSETLYSMQPSFKK